MGLTRSSAGETLTGCIFTELLAIAEITGPFCEQGLYGGKLKVEFENITLFWEEDKKTIPSFF